jgi:hypothetical protein
MKVIRLKTTLVNGEVIYGSWHKDNLENFGKLRDFICFTKNHKEISKTEIEEGEVDEEIEVIA